MNQRSSRNKDASNNNLGFVSIGSGGHVSRHSPNQEPQIQVPQKATGDVKPEPQKGAAKASPNFKPVAPPAKNLTPEEEKKTIAANSKPAEDAKKSEEPAE